MKNIKIFSLFLALLMCICLVGCSEKDNNTDDTSSPSGTSSYPSSSDSSGTSSKQTDLSSSSSVSSMTDEELEEMLSSILSDNGYEVGPGGEIELPEDVFE